MIVRRALVGWVVANGVVSEPVAVYERCETPSSPEARALDRWRAAFGAHPAARACHSPFCGIPSDTSGGGLYLRDRCWAPRAVCALTDGNGTLFVGQRDADGRALEAGRYIAVLGPAASLGAASHVGFADVLRRSLGVPVVNFGRGGVGPDFGGAPALLHRVAANAAAVVVVLMAGRSSANSLSPAGVPALERDAAVAAASPRLAARLRNESLATAAEEYARLAASLRTNAGREPPDVVLVWLSECSLKRGGCAHPRAFPQFYTIEAGAPARVAEIAKTLGATRLVDASYDLERLGSPIALALDECANPACPPPSARDARVCAMDAVRREIGSSASACTKRCAFVLPSYYPPDAAHAAVARALAPWARAALARRGAVVAAPALPLFRRQQPPRLLSPEEGAGGRGLDLRGHIFFAHVHKCSGLAFAKFLRRAVSEAGGSWCERLIAADLARPAVALGSVAAWWRGADSDASPECTLLTLETPTTHALRAEAGRSPKAVTLRRRAPSSNTINVLHTTEEHCALARFLATGGAPEASAWCERHGCARECAATTARSRRRRQLGVWMPSAAVVAAAEARWEARARRNATPAREPQVLVMVRDPVARCRSHWLFDQRMCRARRHVAHSREYCAAFLRRFGAVGSAESHRAFAREHCRDQFAPALDGADAALRFVGIAERYAASLCLLLYDAGRFPRELCACNGTAKLLAEAARPVDEQIASSFKFKASLAASDVGHVPRLRLRRAELEALGATDVARYRAARAHFEARVREAEARVGQKFANCPRARPAPSRPPKRPSRVRALGAGIGALSLLLLALRRIVWRGGPRVR